VFEEEDVLELGVSGLHGLDCSNYTGTGLIQTLEFECMLFGPVFWKQFGAFIAGIVQASKDFLLEEPSLVPSLLFDFRMQLLYFLQNLEVKSLHKCGGEVDLLIAIDIADDLIESGIPILKILLVQKSENCNDFRHFAAERWKFNVADCLEVDFEEAHYFEAEFVGDLAEGERSRAELSSNYLISCSESCSSLCLSLKMSHFENSTVSARKFFKA
jgi:hypothetical protein